MKALLALALSLAVSTTAQALPGFDATRRDYKVSDLTLLDRHGAPIQTLRLDKSRRALPWVRLPEVSPALLRALLYSEDRNFYEHSGVDWSAVAASAWGNLWNRRTRGASTLTMQLAGLLDEERRGGRRNVGEKLGQIWQAGQLEKQWSKAQILEAYLNLVPVRGELVGVHAAAQVMFGKAPAGLDARESALLAALLRAPNAKPAVVAPRACALLKLQGLNDCAGLDQQAEAAFTRRAGMPLGEQIAPHFARQALKTMKAGGATQQRSTLDAGLQRQALTLLREQLRALQGRQVEDGAIVVLDNASGEVRAWVGSSGGGFSDAPEVDAVLARRQPGSTLKPFLYELALEKRLITAASLLDDSPAQIKTPTGLYLPQNYDRHFRGWVSARSALGNSMNVPAVRVGLMVGIDPFYERLNALGLGLSENGGFYGPSLALGSAEVTLLGLTNAYRALANGGVYGEPRQPPRRRVLSAAASFVVNDILADNNARALTFGLDSALATGGFAAVKTGTSKDMRDNWCLGFSERYTVGVWVGNASGEAMHAVSGVSGAAPVWAGLMRYLHGRTPSQPPRAPAGLLAQQVRFDAGAEPARREWFLPGTALARVQAAAHMQPQGAQGIRNPQDGAIYALDPDIPPQAQRLKFEGAPGVWQLDGRRIGRGASVWWSPMPGRHELKLLSAAGAVIETVKFEVRGATLVVPKR